MMKKVLTKLFKIQCILACILIVIGVVTGSAHIALSLASGAIMSISATLVSMAFFRKIPEVLPAKTFFRLMLVNEGLKWLAVILSGIFLLPYVAPLGLVIGFIVTYSGYFWIMYADRGT